jgi:hypothetical protein
MYVQTTLVKYILEEQHGHRIAVILNEFGEETGIESAFVQDGQVGAAAVNAAGPFWTALYWQWGFIQLKNVAAELLCHPTIRTFFLVASSSIVKCFSHHILFGVRSRL